MATASPNDMFNRSVDRLFQGWTVFQLAVQHGFGGQHSREKAAWMIESICNWFQENDGIEPYELQEFISTLLDNEFDTRAEDGSLQEIAKTICTNFALCQSGQASAVMERLQRLPEADMNSCMADKESQDVDMDDSTTVGDHNMHAMMNGMDIGSSSSHDTRSHDTGSHDTSSNNEGASTHENSHSTQQDDENPDPEVDDGWKVIRKKDKRKR